MLTDDEKYMSRCLQLAQMAEGKTSPNPMVGAVVVHNDKIISEGYHHKAGCPHAEPNAINAVKDKQLLQNSTLYVSLEPCCHRGKTPPCAQLIIDSHIPRVVVATLDPNPKVAGKGVEMMKKAGIDVTLGILEKEAKELNRRFFTFQTQNRPYVTLKWAETADHYIDKCRNQLGNGPVKISNNITKTLNHHLRYTEDAIMVATTTALLDNPHLTITKWCGQNPLRVVIDRTCKIPADAKIFDFSAKTLVFTSAEYRQNRKDTAENVEYKEVIFDNTLPEQILNYLAQIDISSIIIEGGAKWLQTIIDSNLWDEARVETSPATLHSGIKAPKIEGTIVRIEHFDKNIITHIKPYKQNNDIANL